MARWPIRRLCPPALARCTAVAAGGYHSLALLPRGMVTGWGDNSFGQLDVPAAATNVIAIAAGETHSVALRADGVVVAWGDDTFRECDPDPTKTGITAIAAGGYNTLVLAGETPPSPLLAVAGFGNGPLGLSATTVRGKALFLFYKDGTVSTNWVFANGVLGNGRVETLKDPTVGSAMRIYRVRQQ